MQTGWKCGGRIAGLTLEQALSRERRIVQLFVCLGWRWLGSRLRDGLGRFDKWVKDLLIVLDKLVWWPWWVLHHALTPDQYQRIIDIKEALLIEGVYWSTLEIFAHTMLSASWAAQWGLPRAADSFRGWGALFYPITRVNAPLLCNYSVLLNAPFPFSGQPNTSWEEVYWQASQHIMFESLVFQFLHNSTKCHWYLDRWFFNTL